MTNLAELLHTCSAILQITYYSFLRLQLTLQLDKLAFSIIYKLRTVVFYRL